MAAASMSAIPVDDILASINGTRNAAKAGKGSIDAAQDRFLTLLTTQMRNQDPLNPLDNATVTSQLAQISTVDGIERLNAALSKLLSSSSDDQSLQAAGLVGHGVLVPGTGIDLADGTAFGGVDLGGAADSVKVLIKDSIGQIIRSLNLGDLEAGSHTFGWDGKADNGALAAAGSYRFEVEALRGGEKVVATALQLGMVSSVVRSASGVSLDLGALGRVTLADVKQII